MSAISMNGVAIRSPAAMVQRRRRTHTTTACMVAPFSTPALRGRKCQVRAQSESVSSKPLRLIQHKQEAFWFYRYLSIVYDTIVNPGHWTEDMREEALSIAGLDGDDCSSLTVYDVGGGTGFTTLGIVKTIPPENVTLVDQSPHQLEKARAKKELGGVTVIEGDAEDIPLPTDSADRYVSAGSIEYWPEPQRGICEAYRVIKKGGRATIIGPVHPTNPVSAFFADLWMLFPTEQEYIDWFTNAGFQDIELKRIGPAWYRGNRDHGLIMGCSVTGVKPEAGQSPMRLEAKKEQSGGNVSSNPLLFFVKVILGSLGGLYYFFVPLYFKLLDVILPKVKVE